MVLDGRRAKATGIPINEVFPINEYNININSEDANILINFIKIKIIEIEKKDINADIIKSLSIPSLTNNPAICNGKNNFIMINCNLLVSYFLKIIPSKIKGIIFINNSNILILYIKIIIFLGGGKIIDIFFYKYK